jgi:hypothetical protein
VFLLAFDYTLDADSQVVFDATAANAFQFWVNERLIGEVWDYPDGDASKDVWRATARFPAGPLRVRVAVGNFPTPGTPNGGLYVMAATRPTVLGDDYDEEWLFTTADGWDFGAGAPGRWRALGYDSVASNPPGPEIGWVIVDLFSEAQARGELTAWTLGFTATHDSAGEPWAAINGLAGVTVDVGSTYLQVLDHLRDSGLIEYDARLDGDGMPVLHAWAPGGGGEAKPEGLVIGSESGGGNVTGLDYDVDHSGRVDQLLVGWRAGTFRVGSGPRSGFVAVEARTIEEATALASAQLGVAATVESVTAGVAWSDQTAGPYFGWGKLDTVATVLIDGTEGTARVVGFNVSADRGTGRPVFTPMLGVNPVRPERRLARTVFDAAAGNLGGRSAAAIPSTSRQRPFERLDQLQLGWSVPATVEELESGFRPPEQLMRANRVVATAKSGTGDTYFAVVDEVPNLLLDVTLGAGTPGEAWNTFQASVLRPSMRLQLLVGGGGDLADHEGVEIVAYGARLGVSAVPTVVDR